MHYLNTTKERLEEITLYEMTGDIQQIISKLQKIHNRHKNNFNSILLDIGHDAYDPDSKNLTVYGERNKTKEEIDRDNKLSEEYKIKRIESLKQELELLEKNKK